MPRRETTLATTKQRMADPRAICTFRSEKDFDFMPTPMPIQQALPQEPVSKMTLESD